MSHFVKKMFDVDSDIPDLPGKVVLVTGGNAGIDRSTCLCPARDNPARIIILTQNPKTGESTIKAFQEAAPKVEVAFVKCSLGSFVSVQGAAKQVLSSTQRLDVLLCNVGVLNAPTSLTEDGYEVHFDVNYLSHVLLIKSLLPLLLKTIELHPDVRVVLSSDGCRFHDPRGIIFKDLKITQKPHIP